MTFDDSTPTAQSAQKTYQDLILAGEYDAAALVIGDTWRQLNPIARCTLADLVFRFSEIGRHDPPIFASGIDWDFGEANDG